MGEIVAGRAQWRPHRGAARGGARRRAGLPRRRSISRRVVHRLDPWPDSAGGAHPAARAAARRRALQRRPARARRPLRSTAGSPGTRCCRPSSRAATSRTRRCTTWRSSCSASSRPRRCSSPPTRGTCAARRRAGTRPPTSRARCRAAGRRRRVRPPRPGPGRARRLKIGAAPRLHIRPAAWEGRPMPPHPPPRFPRARRPRRVADRIRPDRRRCAADNIRST